jgi:hypothetical protein
VVAIVVASGDVNRGTRTPISASAQTSNGEPKATLIAELSTAGIGWVTGLRVRFARANCIAGRPFAAGGQKRDTYVSRADAAIARAAPVLTRTQRIAAVPGLLRADCGPTGSSYRRRGRGDSRAADRVVPGRRRGHRCALISRGAVADCVGLGARPRLARQPQGDARTPTGGSAVLVFRTRPNDATT